MKTSSFYLVDLMIVLKGHTEKLYYKLKTDKNIFKVPRNPTIAHGYNPSTREIEVGVGV